MGDFSDGATVMERLVRLEIAHAAHAADCVAYRVAHEANDGAHAPAFKAHGMSPGPIEDAEETAGAILNTAADAIEDVADAASAVADAAASTAESGADTVADGPEELTDEVDDDDEPHEDEAEPQREPERKHPLHKRLWGG